MTSAELRAARDKAWAKYYTALQSNYTDSKCMELMCEFEELNKQYKKVMRNI